MRQSTTKAIPKRRHAKERRKESEHHGARGHTEIRRISQRNGRPRVPIPKDPRVCFWSRRHTRAINFRVYDLQLSLWGCATEVQQVFASVSHGDSNKAAAFPPSQNSSTSRLRFLLPALRCAPGRRTQHRRLGGWRALLTRARRGYTALRDARLTVVKRVLANDYHGEPCKPKRWYMHTVRPNVKVCPPCGLCACRPPWPSG